MPNDASDRNELQGTAGQVAWATEIRTRVTAEFDRFARSLNDGANRFRALDRAEISVLLAVLEEHRSSVLGMAHAEYFINQWQDPGDRVQRVVSADGRWKAITEARAGRMAKAPPVAPIRYMGFDDVAGVRIYKFGRFPSHNGMEIFTVRMPVAMFLKHKISFQDGPGMTSAIMAAGTEPRDHLVTDEDSLEFISRRPVKAERKPFKHKYVQPNQ
jgi:hypothetical protein